MKLNEEVEELTSGGEEEPCHPMQLEIGCTEKRMNAPTGILSGRGR